MSYRLSLIVLMIFVSSVLNAQDMRNPEAVLAEVWINHAADLLKDSTPSIDALYDAVDALDAAGEFQSPGADAYYLRAITLMDDRIIYPDTSALRLAYTLALKSIDDATGVSARIPFDERAVLLARLALRLKDYRGFLDVYDTWPIAYQDNPPLLAAAARSALYLGSTERAVMLARKGESLSHGREGHLEPGINYSQAAFRAMAVAAGDAVALNTLDSAWLHWGFAMEQAIMPWILGGYVHASIVDSITPFLSSDGRKAIDALFGLMDISPALDDLALAKRLWTPDALLTEYANFTGVLLEDTNYDGFPEETVRLTNGKPDYRRIDYDQDGRNEWNIVFSNGKPIQVSLNHNALIINYLSNAYPEVVTMESNADGARGVASFKPGMFALDLGSEDMALFGPISQPQWREQNLWPYLNRIDIWSDDLPNEEIGEVTTWLFDGYPLRALETRYAQDYSDHPIWVREILYSDGMIIAARRAFHPHQDVWQLYEKYENGRMIGLAWDPHMQGTPLYLKDWALGKFLQIQAWDVNADGWMDVRRFLVADQASVRDLLVTEARAEDLLPWKTWEIWE